MFVNFKKTFNPSEKERKKQSDFSNKLIQHKLDKYGECCLTCKHTKYVQESPYNDYCVCRATRKLIDYDNPVKCECYKFVGWTTPDDFKVRLGKEK